MDYECYPRNVVVRLEPGGAVCHKRPMGERYPSILHRPAAATAESEEFLDDEVKDQQQPGAAKSYPRNTLRPLVRRFGLRCPK